jgi:hypothetical protein
MVHRSSVQRALRGPSPGGCALYLVLTLVVALGCAKDNTSTGPDDQGSPVADCEGCHTSREMLINSAAPDTTTPPGDSGEGCGGSVPQLEVWEKYQVSSDFLSSSHGSGSCVGCHGGQGRKNTKEVAHQGMVADPSDGDAGACHRSDCRLAGQFLTPGSYP